jgi:phosphoribosylformimino-5-aminoimidazole carboxamide ribotide isomerase
MTAGASVCRLIPAVDILGDEAVRLVRGAYDDVSLREPDPLALVRRLVAAGAELVHVVDLTAARSGETRPDLFRRVVEAAQGAGIQASGGIRTPEDAEALMAAGAARLVVGTAAFAEGDLLDELVARIGEQLVVALDVRDGVVRVRGWEEATGFTVDAAIERCRAAGVSRLLCTAIDRDGTLGGPALDLLGHVVRSAGLPVIAAGGVRSVADAEAVAAVGCEAAIVGRALLEGGVPFAALGPPRHPY